jgi:gamma-glutamyl hercynylcysteine S-oxide synthase
MSKKDFRPDNDAPSVAAVRLSPILGVRPGVYLTVLYSLALILLVFFLLFFPGLKNRGSYVSFAVQPGKASVIVDGKFAGTIPGTIFLKHGRRHVEVQKAFYAAQSKDIDVGGRIFATLIVPDRRKEVFNLSATDPAGMITYAFEDFTSNPFVPNILTNVSAALSTLPDTPARLEIKNKMYDFLFNCMHYINPLLDSSMTPRSSENQIGESINSLSLIGSNGSFLTPSSLIEIVRKSIQVNEEYPNSAEILLLSLSRAESERVASTQWMTKHLAEYRDALSTHYKENSLSESRASARPNVQIAGISFRSIPTGVLVMGKDDDLDKLGKSVDILLPHPVHIGSYYLSENEVTNFQYQSFVDAVPEWKPSNRKALADKNLCTEDYLSDWTDDRFPAGRSDYPVVSVSYEAARAYCTWFSKKAGAILPGLIARLPSEAEWEWAARGGLRGMPYPLGEKPGDSVFFIKGITGPSKAGVSSPNGYGLRDMMGNAWEWCSDSFGTTDYLLTSLDPDKNAESAHRHPDSTDKVVRGGGWNMTKEAVKVYTRGSQPAQWCTPYLGFRVAIAAP